MGRVGLTPPPPPGLTRRYDNHSRLLGSNYELRLHKLLFHFKALLGESIILLLPPVTCKAYPGVILLHDHYAIYAPPPTPPPLYAYFIQYW